MKPPIIPLEKIKALPAVYCAAIPETYQDENGHMNIRWYLHIYDDAGYPLVESFGLTPDFHQRNHTGGFDLEHHIHYLNEIHVGDNVVVYARLLARTAKRIHYMLFMINETRDELASMFECVNSFADLSLRRTAAYPQEIADRIDAMLRQHEDLDWTAPTCGVMAA